MRWNLALMKAMGANIKLNMSVYELITTGSISNSTDIYMTIVATAQIYMELAMLLHMRQPSMTQR